MRSLVIIFGVVAGLVALGCAEEPALVEPSTEAAPMPHPIVGAWSVTGFSGADADGNPLSTASPQPSLYLFVDGHYSVMYASEETTTVPRSQARQLYADGNWPPSTQPADADKIASYDSFIANSGTYEISGSSVTTDPIIAKDPNFMTAGSVTFEFEVVGDTLTLSASDGNGSGTTTLTRLE